MIEQSRCQETTHNNNNNNNNNNNTLPVWRDRVRR